MEIRGSLPNTHGPYKTVVPKKPAISETNIKRISPEVLQDRGKIEADFVELEGGFTMYPSEIIEFSQGSDSQI